MDSRIHFVDVLGRQEICMGRRWLKTLRPGCAYWCTYLGRFKSLIDRATVIEEVGHCKEI